MQLSIIIVNYNVRYFLEQCLFAVYKAAANIRAEVIVVDNHSTDGSIDYLHPIFPDVTFISNTQNLGFAKANNQGLAVSRGEYILFLNPDTLVPEDCFERCLSFMKDHARAGALGVRMLDGSGRLLPESKRSFPSPLASFYKLVGLASIFPRSGIFNKYALGNLDENKDHKVDVLAGAFMMVRKPVLTELNGFDEAYFLYGEDVDLSYRLQKAGWQNYYFSGTAVIHFKGESAGKKNLDHVKFFYNAMLIFVQRHYTSGTAKWFGWCIRLAIMGRALLSAFFRLVKPVLLPLIDFCLVWLSLQFTRIQWVTMVRHGTGFGVPFISYALPMFTMVYISTAAFMGLYDKRYKTSRTVLSVAFAMICVLAVYSLLPETLRFSRGVMLWGGMLGGSLIIWLRQSVFFNRRSFFNYEWERSGQTVVVGSEKEYAEIMVILKKAMLEETLLGRVAPVSSDDTAICHIAELPALEKKIPFSEIIFCEGTVSLSEIIEMIQNFSHSNLHILFHLSGSKSIVGSYTPASAGKIVGPFTAYRIAEPHQQRMKRIIDAVLSLLLLITAPVHLLLHPKGLLLLRNAWQVLMGHKTWVGYATQGEALPPIKKSILAHVAANGLLTEALLEKSDRRYAKNYDWWQDALIVLRQYGRLA